MKISEDLILAGCVVGFVYYMYTRYDDDTIEHLGSDFNNSFYGVSLWNGWPY